MCISVIQVRTSVKKFSVYINQIRIRVESIQIRHRSGQRLNWMTVLRTCCIFREFERHKYTFEWRQCKFECWENKIEWRIGCAWPKSFKLNAHKMNLVDKITKLTGKTYILSILSNVLKTLLNIVEAPFNKFVDLWGLCCMMMFRWPNKQPEVQQFLK